MSAGVKRDMIKLPGILLWATGTSYIAAQVSHVNLSVEGLHAASQGVLISGRAMCGVASVCVHTCYVPADMSTTCRVRLEGRAQQNLLHLLGDSRIDTDASERVFGLSPDLWSLCMLLPQVTSIWLVPRAQPLHACVPAHK